MLTWPGNRRKGGRSSLMGKGTGVQSVGASPANRYLYIHAADPEGSSCPRCWDAPAKGVEGDGSHRKGLTLWVGERGFQPRLCCLPLPRPRCVLGCRGGLCLSHLGAGQGANRNESFHLLLGGLHSRHFVVTDGTACAHSERMGQEPG